MAITPKRYREPEKWGFKDPPPFYELEIYNTDGDMLERFKITQ